MKEQIRLFQEKRRNLTHGLDVFRTVLTEAMQSVTSLDHKTLRIKDIL